MTKQEKEHIKAMRKTLPARIKIRYFKNYREVEAARLRYESRYEWVLMTPLLETVIGIRTEIMHTTLKIK